MTNSPVTASHQPELYRRICDRILATPNRRITFAQFMDWALYEPDVGYYGAHRQKIGAKGDFVTSPHFGADFGELLAEQFLEFWIALDKPTPFQIVEMGAGQGLIAQDVLHYLRDRARTQPDSDYSQFWDALHYIISEKATAMIAEQQYHLKPFLNHHKKLSWQPLEALADDSIIGCFFSNELVDALPVHRMVLQQGKPQEIYVTWDKGRGFIETIAEPSSPALKQYLDWLEIDLTSNQYPENYQTEICLVALDWLATVARKLQRGYILTIDYRHTAAQYYSPQRSQGTLQCYFQQSHHSDPYWAVGYQDITTHANFTALQQKGQELGLRTINLTQQGLFLMGLGLGDRITANVDNAGNNLMAVLQRREALHALVNPMGVGGFGVLLQGKGQHLPQNYSFRGFQ
jgi:SAM-dependent MidA family methyltransferase